MQLALLLFKMCINRPLCSGRCASCFSRAPTFHHGKKLWEGNLSSAEDQRSQGAGPKRPSGTWQTPDPSGARSTYPFAPGVFLAWLLCVIHRSWYRGHNGELDGPNTGPLAELQPPEEW